MRLSKKVLSIVLCLIMIFCMIPIIAFAEESGQCGDNITWSLDNDGTLTIVGSGRFPNYTYCVWKDYKSRVKHIVVGNGITNLPSHFAEELYLLEDDLVLPNTLTEIGSWAFKGCNTLERFTIPDGVETLGAGVFENCISLEYVYIPKSVVKIYGNDSFEFSVFGAGIFAGCGTLIDIDIDRENETYSEENNCLIVNSTNTLIAAGVSEIESDSAKTIIPDGVEIIGDYALAGRGINEVYIPSSVKEIRRFAFYDCASLEEINLPNSVQIVGEGAFLDCYNLQSATISSNLEELSRRMFMCCYSLEKVYFNLPSKVKAIRECAFMECEYLTNISIPASVEIIEGDSFLECTNLSSITASNNIKEINGNPFRKTAYFDNPNNWTDNCLYLNNYLLKVRETASGNINVKAGTTIICGSSFKNCEDVENVFLPSGITYIGEDAFYGCSNLNLNIPNSVEYIGRAAFCYCKKLEEIHIPPLVTTLEDSTFVSCESARIIDFADNSALTRIGDGVFEGCKTVTRIEIPSSVKNIDGGAFYLCSNLQYISIPNNLEHIGSYAFIDTAFYLDDSNWDDDVLYLGNYLINSKEVSGSLQIKNGTTLIADEAFQYCEDLESVAFPSGLKWIGDAAFHSCLSLQTISLPDSVIEVGDYAFAYCENVNEINLGSGVKRIKNRAFESIEKVNEITIPSSVELVSYQAFAGCNELRIVKIEEGLKRIDTSAFRYNPELKTVILPKSLIYVDEHVFGYLEDIYYSGSENDWNNIEIHPNFNDDLLSANKHWNYSDESHDDKKTTKIIIPATCTSPGIEIDVCLLCGKPLGETRTIPATGHDYGDWEDELSSEGIPTGYKIKKCKKCGLEYKSDGLKKLIDEKTGIIIEFGDDPFYENVELIVEQVYEETVFAVLDRITVTDKPAKVFDIKIIKDGKEVQPNGTIKVRIPLPDGFNTKYTEVYHVTGTTFTPMSAVVDENGYLVFETNHFSYYVVIEKNSTGSSRLIIPSNTEVEYASTVTVKAKATDVPEGYYVALYDGGTQLARGSNTEVSYTFPGEFTGSKNITAKIIDDNGNVQKDGNGNDLTASFDVKAKSGFFAKLIAFFKRLFKSLPAVIVEPK